MSQSSLEREILYDRHDQEAYQEADASCKTIERSIDTWTELKFHAEKKIFELHEDLAGARKKVEEIHAARRQVDDVSVVSVVSVSDRMLCQIKEAFSTIDDMLRRDIVLPDTLALRLESLTILPDHAPSEIAALAYQDLNHHVKANGLDARQFAVLDRQMLDIVCFACCRFIDPCDKVEAAKSFKDAFDNKIHVDLYSKLGNSRYNLFVRDFNTHPAKERGSRHPEEDERATRIQRRQSERVHRSRMRTTSEPISESRLMTGSFVQLQ